MKSIFVFNLPEEASEHRQALEGSKWKLVVWKFYYDNLRKWIKYGHEFKTADEALEKVRETLFELLEEDGLDLDE